MGGLRFMSRSTSVCCVEKKGEFCCTKVYVVL
jgi:hypothetical protein